MTDNQPSPKRTIITFIGGDADGRVLNSDSPDPADQFEIRSILAMTRRGEFGRTFHSATREGMEPGELPKFIAGRANKYVVTERLESDGELRIGVTVVDGVSSGMRR
jgi:hypothetical protein